MLKPQKLKNVRPSTTLTKLADRLTDCVEVEKAIISCGLHQDLSTLVHQYVNVYSTRYSTQADWAASTPSRRSSARPSTDGCVLCQNTIALRINARPLVSPPTRFETPTFTLNRTGEVEKMH